MLKSNDPLELRICSLLKECTEKQQRKVYHRTAELLRIITSKGLRLRHAEYKQAVCISIACQELKETVPFDALLQTLKYNEFIEQYRLVTKSLGLLPLQLTVAQLCTANGCDGLRSHVQTLLDNVLEHVLPQLKPPPSALIVACFWCMTHSAGLRIDQKKLMRTAFSSLSEFKSFRELIEKNVRTKHLLEDVQKHKDQLAIKQPTSASQETKKKAADDFRTEESKVQRSKRGRNMEPVTGVHSMSIRSWRNTKQFQEYKAWRDALLTSLPRLQPGLLEVWGSEANHHQSGSQK